MRTTIRVIRVSFYRAVFVLYCTQSMLTERLFEYYKRGGNVHWSEKRTGGKPLGDDLQCPRYLCLLKPYKEHLRVYGVLDENPLCIMRLQMIYSYRKTFSVCILFTVRWSRGTGHSTRANLFQKTYYSLGRHAGNIMTCACLSRTLSLPRWAKKRIHSKKRENKEVKIRICIFSSFRVSKTSEIKTE